MAVGERESRVQDEGGEYIPGARKPVCKGRWGGTGTPKGSGANREGTGVSAKAPCVILLPSQSAPKGLRVSEG